jgi:citrate lyase subunit beta/citryl-CoA lyase
MQASPLNAAAAGSRGDRVRSDLWVGYEPGDGPLELAVRSKVDYLYADAIEAAVRRVADAFGVGTGRLEVDDAGALEWVILARVETCLRRAGAEGPAVLPSAHDGATVPVRRERLRRSRLYVPGNQPKLMASAGLYEADGIILDLEDSVPPAEKDAARVLVRNALVALDWGVSERMVRVNQGEVGLEDLREIAPHNPHLVLLPKVEDPIQVQRAAEVAPKVLLMPILESPAGIHRAFEVAAAHPSVVALTLGLEDLSAELGAPRTEEGAESFLARQQTVYAARAAGVQPIASVYSDIRDEAGLQAYVARERGLGSTASAASIRARSRRSTEGSRRPTPRSNGPRRWCERRGMPRRADWGRSPWGPRWSTRRWSSRPTASSTWRWRRVSSTRTGCSTGRGHDVGTQCRRAPGADGRQRTRKRALRRSGRPPSHRSQGRAAHRFVRRLSRRRRQASRLHRRGPARRRAGRRHDRLEPPPPAQRRFGGQPGVRRRGLPGRARPHVVPVGLVSGPRQPAAAPGLRCDPPHRGIHERAPGRLLLGGQDARPRCAALPRRTLAGHPGR